VTLNHEPSVESPFAGDRPPRYLATLRAFEQAVREACAMSPDLHDLIGEQSIEAPMLAFVRVAADAGEAPETVLRRVKGVLRPYERAHDRQFEALVREAIASYFRRGRE
jgi:hypothetical protein